MDAKDFLVDYFSQYLTLSDEEVQLIKKEDIIREYNKGEAAYQIWLAKQ